MKTANFQLQSAPWEHLGLIGPRGQLAVALPLATAMAMATALTLRRAEPTRLPQPAPPVPPSPHHVVPVTLHPLILMSPPAGLHCTA